MKLNRDRLYIAMAEKGVTMTKLAASSGLTPAGLRRAMKEGTRPCTAGRIAKALGCRVEDIMQEDSQDIVQKQD